MKMGNLLLGGGLLAAVAAFVYKLKQTSARIETVVSAKIHSLSLSGLTIRVDCLIKNPTGSSLSIKYPFVKLIYKGSTLGSSQSVNRDVTIPAYGEVMIDGIMISIPVIGLFSITMDLIQALMGSDQGIKIQISTLSSINLPWKTIPFEKMDEVVLKQNP